MIFYEQMKNIWAINIIIINFRKKKIKEQFGFTIKHAFKSNEYVFKRGGQRR